MKRRNTGPKTAVLDALKTSNAALSHDMLQSKLGTTINRATIYRVLNRFCEDGRVHRIVGDDGKQYFALCLDCGGPEEEHSHNHFHFKCVACGKVECLDHEIIVPLPDGYSLESFNGWLSGRCNSC